MRAIKTDEITEPVGSLVESLSAENSSVIIRDSGDCGVAIAALLAGEEYQEYARWQSEQAWAVIEQGWKLNERADPQDTEQFVAAVVEEVRRERHGAKIAS